MLAKLRSLITDAKRKNRPFKVTTPRFMPKRGQFESLEDRRMLSVASGFSFDSIAEPILPGESREVYMPHHADAGHGGAPNTHFSPSPAGTGDAHHFAWQDRDPSTSNVIDIWYDFRDQGGEANSITAGQMQRAVDALTEWENASAGAINFIQNTTAAAANVINIGTGNLAALGNFTSAPGGILGLGGGFFDHNANANHSIAGGVAWQDFAETWDETIGNGNPAGTFDYYTVVGQEIGHALGLGHTDDLTGADIMDGSEKVSGTVLIEIFPNLLKRYRTPFPGPKTVPDTFSGPHSCRQCQ